MSEFELQAYTLISDSPRFFVFSGGLLLQNPCQEPQYQVEIKKPRVFGAFSLFAFIDFRFLTALLTS